MKKFVAVIFIAGFLGGCSSVAEFKQGSLNCIHTVSTQLMGTAQVLSCEKENQVVYINSFGGTAGLEPIEKVLEAGVAGGIGYGVIKQLGRPVETDSIIHIRP